MNRMLLLALLIAAQLMLPCWMITSHEKVLTQGRVYRFETRPVDPYDVLRGRYVSVGIKQNFVEVQGQMKLDPGQQVYLILAEDARGFAYVADVSAYVPGGRDFIKAKVYYQQSNKVYFRMPFDRYYMNEVKAPQAEKLYQQHNTRDRQDAYIVVRVMEGNAQIEDLFIGDKPIREYFDGPGIRG